MPDAQIKDDETAGLSHYFRGQPNTKPTLEAKAEIATFFVASNVDWPFELACAWQQSPWGIGKRLKHVQKPPHFSSA